MDEYDRACEIEQRDRERALAFRNPTLPVCGNCYNCGESCRGLFCNFDCLSDYQDRERARRRDGL